MMRYNVQNKVSANETNSDLDTTLRSESERSHSSVSLASLSLFAKNLKKQAGGLKQKMTPFRNRSEFSDFKKMESFQNLSILLEASHEFSHDSMQEFQIDLKNNNESIAKLNFSETTMKTCEESFSNISFEEGDELGHSSLGSSVRMGEWILDTEGPGRGVNLVVPCKGGTLPHMQLCITRSPGRRVRFNLDQRQNEWLAAQQQTKLPVSPKSPPPRSVLSESPNYSPRRTSAHTFTPHPSPTDFSSPPLFEPNELDVSGRSTGSTDSLDLSREKRSGYKQRMNGRLSVYHAAPRRTPRRGGRRPRRKLQSPPTTSPLPKVTHRIGNKSC